MYLATLAHYDCDGGEVFIKVQSKHRTEEAAKKAVIKKMASRYGWQSTAEFKTEHPDVFDRIMEKGKHIEAPEALDFWVDIWEVIEI